MRKVPAMWLLLALALVLVPGVADAETWYVRSGGPNTTGPATSCAGGDIQAAIDAAANGDTVQIGTGTCSITTVITVSNKNIHTKGAGIDQTILLENINRAAANDRMFNFTNFDDAVNDYWRLSHMTIARGSQAQSFDGMIVVGGTPQWLRWRIDHIKFDNVNNVGVNVFGCSAGLIDNNIFILGPSQGIIARHRTCDGTLEGHGSWAAPTNLGSVQALYVENNVVSTFDTGHNQALIDGFDGDRKVVRFNDINDSHVISHDTGQEHPRRGGRKFEYYANVITQGEESFNYCYDLTGTGVLFANVCDDTDQHFAKFRVDRVDCPPNGACESDWGQCNGSSPYDQNQSGLSGYRCVDQGGAGQSNLISGEPASPVAWVGNALEPIYSWNNLRNGSATGPSTGGRVSADRDFISDTSSFMSSGTSLPGTCDPDINGVTGARQGFFKTNEGSWNDGSNANYTGQGVLYQCTETNTWTLFYTPLAFPHPYTVSGALSDTPGGDPWSETLRIRVQ